MMLAGFLLCTKYKKGNHIPEDIVGTTGETIPMEVAKINYDTTLLSRIVYAEAGNQGYWGKRYVAAVVINRVNSNRFPNTVSEVISQPGQFEAYSKIYKYPLDEESSRAVVDEIAERSDTEIIAFRTKHYHKNYKNQ